MPSVKLVVAGDDRFFVSVVESHLKEKLGQAAVVCGLSQLAEHAWRIGSAVLVLTAARSDDVGSIAQQVRRACLEAWKGVLLVVGNGTVAEQEELCALEGRIDRLLTWPDDAARLAGRVEEQLQKVSGCPSAEQENAQTALARWRLRCTPSLHSSIPLLVRYGASDASVLVSGETGTGKRYLAQLLHDISPRAGQGFRVIPCAVLSAQRAERELFGDSPATAPKRNQPRKSQPMVADKGTVLLDEIEALPRQLQARLSGLLEARDSPFWHEGTSPPFRPRILASCCYNMDQAGPQNRLLAALQAKLGERAVHLPPLRKRVGDIEPLVRALAWCVSHRFRVPLFDIDLKTFESLRVLRWPGNIRDLECVVQHAVVSCNGTRLSPEHIPSVVRQAILEESERRG
jgi:DNA-binding NtrC family response regulator